MVTNVRTPVETARQNLADARRTSISRLYEFETASDALREVKRRSDDPQGDLGDTQSAYDQALANFNAARATESALRDTLQQRLADWLPDGTSEQDDIGRLLASEPVVLFPVRLETRFAGNVLKVRVFPDEIFLDIHETALTQAEYDAARAYYEKLNQSGSERELWRDLAARFGVERSAYILREMLPIFGEAGLSQSSSYTLSSSTCGGTLVGGQQEELFFPQDVQFRSSNWTRPGDGVLPDRWLVITYHQGARKVTPGKRIIEPLAMTADPKALEADLKEIPGTTLTIDDRIRWTVDFDRAVEIGMGIEVPLTGTEPTDGFERVIVLGVKTSLNELDTSRMLEKLFDAHHYTRGVALLGQGTPTNNTEGHPTPYPRRENAASESYITERAHAPLDRKYSHHCLPATANGNLLATAVGVPSGVFANVDRAYLTDTYDARSMNEALWPGTLGYFMQHMMRGLFSADAIKNTRTYFRKFVLGRGPAPAFRVGATPYGVLPIASLRRWAPRRFSPSDSGGPRDIEFTALGTLEAGLLAPLQSLMDVWLDGVPLVPRIRAAQANPDLDVATVLSTCASSREFRVRYGHTEQVEWLFFHFFGWDYREVVSRLDALTATTFGRIGKPTWRAPIGRTRFFPAHPLFTGDLVAPPETLSETLSLPPPNFIAGILDATVANLNQGLVDNKPATQNLLYTLLRHAAMTEYARLAAVEAAFDWQEYSIFNVPSLVGTIQHIIPLTLSVNDLVLKTRADTYRKELEKLKSMPSAELERMLTETLDLTAHRLDAWVSAFACRRLDDMRTAQILNGSRLAPKGNFLAGYGWLQEVRPRQHDVTNDEVLGPIETQPNNGGFIHSPSMTHASAAAVLRNGHMSFRKENPSAYGIDLSSARVRAGRRLFEGVRNGQPLGALLGYELERGLHEGHPGVGGLEQLRFTLRGLFPLVANKSGEDPESQAEDIAARNVVDGSLLLRAYKAKQLPFGQKGLPAVGTQAYLALKAELDKLDEMHDAAADLLTAEGVFQLVRGNIDAAIPTLNNVVEGNQPPESVIARSARGGTGLAHRVALVFPSDAQPTLPAGWPSTPSPRAAAEPLLDKWIGTLVGSQSAQSPTRVRAVVTYLDAEDKVIPSTHDVNGQPVAQQNVSVALAELGLRPLDLLALAEVVARMNQGSMLDRRIIAVALGDPERKPDRTPARFQIDYETGDARSFLEVLEVLGTAASVFRSSRPLELRDLLPPAELEQGLAEDEAEPIGGTNAKAFYQRGKTARGLLASTRQVLDTALQPGGTDLRAALIAAALIAPMTAFPDPTVSEAELVEAGRAVLQDLLRREAALPAPIPDLPPELDATLSALLLDHGRRTLTAVFGDSFVALPDVDPPRAPELELSLEARSTLLGGDEDAPDRYLQQLARSRERVGRFRKLNLYARAFDQPRPRVDVLQLPHTPGEQWLGLGFAIPDSTPQKVLNLPQEGRNAVLLLSYAMSLDPSVSWNGLVVDDWTETIPNQVEETGIAFHFDSPQSQAPQAVLVAVPSTTGQFWTFEDLVSSLEDTMDLMQIRTVNLEHLDVGQILPMAVIPGNEGVNFTLSTILGALRLGVDALGLES